tara:strand:+ start:50873 stop:52378 length:1506 start_codon:yes stop_codon:yes gene_type:complete
MKHLQYILLIIILPFGFSFSNAQNDFIIEGLEKGRFDVGFQNFWRLDGTRKYALYQDSVCVVKEQSRPILLNVWYPTTKSSKPKMKYAEYFDILNDRPNLKEFSKQLYSFVQGVLSYELFKKEFEELDESEQNKLNTFLNLEVSAVKNASFPNGNFPLIINHSGASSSFEDNSVLFEFLASNGFVVISSQFQDGEGKSLSGDYKEDSYEDIDFIIQTAKREFDFIDANKVALIGHSIGTQTILSYQALKRNKKINKLIGLETSQVYFGSSMNYMYPYTEILSKNLNGFIGNEVLLIAETTATFQLFKNMIGANMIYLTIDRIRHHELISQGVYRTLYQIEESKRSPFLENKYAFICNSILSFLKGDKIEKPTNLLYNINLEHVSSTLPKSSSVINESSDLTPRQFYELVFDFSISKAIAYLKSKQEEKESNPLFRPKFIFPLLYELYSNDKDMLAIYNFYSSLGLKESIITQIENWKWIGQQAKRNKLIKDCNDMIEILNN